MTGSGLFNTAQSVLSSVGNSEVALRLRAPCLLASAVALAGSTLFTVAAPVAAATGDGVQIAPGSISRLATISQPPTEAQCVASFTVPCYDPAQIQTAYDEGPLFANKIDGKGETIVIVDAFGTPTIESDLATFDAQFGLPAPPRFTIIQAAGQVPQWDPSNAAMLNWGGETTLDVEWSHSIAPDANILLVETPVAETEGVAGFPQIVKAENYVINHNLGDVISQSFAATEETFPSTEALLSLRSAYINANAHDVTVLAGAGDAGATDWSNTAATLLYTHPVVAWPSTDPLVTAVGGTQLSLNSAGQRTAPDRAWNDSYNESLNEVFFGNPGPNALAGGGGKSAIFARPSYQNGVASVTGNQRGVPDIAMSAACSGLVDTYQSFPGVTAGWYVTCGTSEATPLMAGIVALADQVAHHRLGLINPALYTLKAEHAPGLVPVTIGNNTVSFTQNGKEYTVQGFSASSQYNLVTGVGTVNAALFVPELAVAASG
jgi:subtilase family serine protease